MKRWYEPAAIWRWRVMRGLKRRDFEAWLQVRYGDDVRLGDQPPTAPSTSGATTTVNL